MGFIRYLVNLFSKSKPTITSPSVSDTSVLSRINSTRQARGIPKLSEVEELVRLASQQAQRCSDAGKLSHTLGGSLTQRMKAAGIVSPQEGECLYEGTREPGSIFLGWFQSPHHKAIMLDPDFRYAGVSQYGEYCCAIFASEVKVGA